MPGEAIFVSRSNGADEDDGLVVSIVLDTYKRTAFLLMLVGKTFKEVALDYNVNI